MRITFVSHFRFMTYKYYLKLKKPMCEIKLNQILNRNPSLIKFLDTSLPHPMIYHFISNDVDDDDDVDVVDDDVVDDDVVVYDDGDEEEDF